MMTSPLTERGQLERWLEQGIWQRIGRRLRDFRIDLEQPRRVRIRARVPSYHVKQLALKAVVEMRAAMQGMDIEAEIDVVA
jgi:hypothetical protein